MPSDPDPPVLTGGFFTDQAVGGGGAGVGFEPGGLRPLQVGAEARVAGLARRPPQAGVGEGRRVLPAPVRHVDLPQADPGSQPLQGGGAEEAVLGQGHHAPYRIYIFFF